MKILLFNLTIVYVSSLLARLNFKTHTLESNQKYYNNFFVFFALLSLILVSGLRFDVGTDYYTYMGLYENIFPNITNPLSESEPGFVILCKILYKISTNSQMMFFVTAVITNICVVLTLRKYSNMFELSMYLYITTFTFYSAFNGLRQYMAAAIIFLGLKYLIERKAIKYLATILIASSFHTSALIMIPVYFLVNYKPLSKRNLVMLLTMFGAFFGYNGFLDTLFSTLEETKYSHYHSFAGKTGEGANFLRFLVYLIPVVISFIYYDKLKSKFNNIDIIMNLCFIGMLFMLLALQHWIFARVTILFDYYYLLLIPKLIIIPDNRSLIKLLYYVILICYFLYSFMLLVSGESHILPYDWRPLFKVMGN
ncbi:EpsG family protein [Domibacillus sp. A3M-37]|uniref:EpsG family protein n=1 Tax=Domibacillus sp. A3M-37 TaxID=2962037 RepID=UPI0020B6DF2B|nr:EpsG family protein [Domibacillus sp. A3M-37]MCP3761404.1 EpsG family protein [Domibacillus sp. A3M-37]